MLGALKLRHVLRPISRTGPDAFAIAEDDGLGLGPLQQLRMPAQGADGARAASDQVGNGSIERSAPKLGPLRRMRPQGRDDPDAELVRRQHRLSAVSGELIVCGRVFVRSSVDKLVAQFAFASRRQGDGLDNFGPRFNGAPRQDFPIIIHEPEYPGGVFMLARWGLVPGWIKETSPKVRPINARCEEITRKPFFRSAYRARRALMPIDGFFEWRAAKPGMGKQPYAVAMADGEPFCLAAIWEEWRDPQFGVNVKTFAIVTCPANELVSEIHDRMPVIIAPDDYLRWISPEEKDPRDLLKPYPAELLKMWPISTRVNKPENDEPSILEPA
jgi:putative SOS response-associated peptidase YedK